MLRTRALGPAVGRQDNRAVDAKVGALETELKFVVPAYRTSNAIRLLDRICDPDPAFPAGIVSSIYFDSRDWAYLGDKRDSDYLKTKVRLRWYERTSAEAGASDRSFAEIKSRVGSRREKMRIEMEYRGSDIAAMELHDPELLRVPARLAAAGAPIRHSLFPSFVVRYVRRRYIERSTRARIAIDYCIGSPRCNKYMLPGASPCELQSSVLEVKGTDGEFPLGLRSALKLGFRREAFSKYYECYRHLAGMLA
jgi:hypothetical protein